MSAAVILHPAFSQQIAIALWHLTWLGAIIGLAAGIGNAWMRRSSPTNRYRLNAAALAVMLFSVPIVLTQQTTTLRADGPPLLVEVAAAPESAPSEAGTATAESGLPSPSPAKSRFVPKFPRVFSIPS